jgi:hypothetical protein
MTMMTVEVGDELIEEVIRLGNFQNAQEAVLKILADYVQKHKKRQPLRLEGVSISALILEERSAAFDLERHRDVMAQPPSHNS